jgi:CDP-paratose 2-epimerase
LLDLLAELHDGELSIEFENWRAADQRYYVADTTKFGALTGWRQTVGVQEGVKRLYEWLVASNQHFPAAPVGISEIAAVKTAGKIQ